MRVLVQRDQHAIHAAGVVVVQQQSHAHAALGCGVQGFKQQLARQVGVPDVVLHVQRALRCVRQQRSSGKGIWPAHQSAA